MKGRRVAPARPARRQRVEVTARGKLVRDLDPSRTVSGQTVQLAIDAGLQEFAARRLGEESGSCAVMDCQTGDILCMASMPAYDPNSLSDGISQTEWAMLSEDERKPLLNKALNALYPPGSTIKPTNAMALLEAGIDPEEPVHCPGGYQLGNRFFRCLGRHGTDDHAHARSRAAATPISTRWAAGSATTASRQWRGGSGWASASTCRWSAKATAPSPTAPGSSAAKYEKPG